MASGEPWNNKDHPDYAPSLDGNTAKEDIQHQSRLQRLTVEMSLYLSFTRQCHGGICQCTAAVFVIQYGYLTSALDLNEVTFTQSCCHRGLAVASMILEDTS